MWIFLFVLPWCLLSCCPRWCFTPESIILCKLCHQCAQDNMKHGDRSRAPREVCGGVCLNQAAVQTKAKCYFSTWGAGQTKRRSKRWTACPLRNPEPTGQWGCLDVYNRDPHPRKWNNSSSKEVTNQDRTEKAGFLYYFISLKMTLQKSIIICW